jgi:hypothetical protein
VKQVDADVELVTVGLEVRLRCFEPRSGAFKNFLAYVWICFVVFEVAVKTFEETLVPLLSVGTLEHVVVGLLVLAMRQRLLVVLPCWCKRWRVGRCP